MKLKTKLLFIAALFVLALLMALTFRSLQATRRSPVVHNQLQSGALSAKQGLDGKMMKGKVRFFDPCANVVVIDDVPFNIGDVDLSGVRQGDYVRVTYGNAMKHTYGKGMKTKVLGSIQVIGGEKE